ncbi:DUF1127 domain-containing protein [Rubellimicrobium aerolatum]|uniref:DUF1127 domain-containing protein n=1 Tax=Rubellimicrobium aerolatum TaxID=490979 RepID=A0ABW0SA95_9RHOB|nr:DUF1127 domain-containing protein [Rubellimicrobium aerolatum]MBP1805213.1 uncharacterized protein YjiS (DUF1127 family) [Rubellimicrobium aerolatum]
MAFATFHPTSAAPSLAQRLTDLRAAWTEHRARRRAYRETLAELEALSDRELADLDLHRSRIPEIAREAARLA